MNLDSKSRLALIVSAVLFVGWFVWAMMVPAPRLDQTQLEQMAKTIDDYKQKHGTYPKNLDGIFPAYEVERLEYVLGTDGFTLRSKMDKTVKIERKVSNENSEEDVRDKYKNKYRDQYKNKEKDEDKEKEPAQN